MIRPDHAEVVTDFDAFGITALTTTRAFGTLGGASDEPAQVAARWDALRAEAAQAGVHRLATSRQVHGAHVLTHEPGWSGWRRAGEADGHLSLERGTAVAVTVADCVPVFIGHPSGAVALLHSGWRGTEARIVEQGIAAFAARGFAAGDLHIHLGPAICGSCYEVSADVATRLLGAPSPTQPVDLGAIIVGHARMLGVRAITTSSRCTKCDNDRFFSHRAGDSGRQVALAYAAP